MAAPRKTKFDPPVPSGYDRPYTSQAEAYLAATPEPVFYSREKLLRCARAGDRFALNLQIGWYFWDETGSDPYGPYLDEETAKAMQQRYINEILKPVCPNAG